MGVHRLLHSSCCFPNTNPAITRQLIRTARTLEAEWWQVCGEAWVQGPIMMCQVLGAFGPLDFTMLRPVLAWRTFWNLWTVYFFNFSKLFLARGQPQITETAGPESADTGVHRYLLRWFRHNMHYIKNSCERKQCNSINIKTEQEYTDVKNY